MEPILFGVIGGIATAVTGAGRWTTRSKAQSAADELARIQQENDELTKKQAALSGEAERLRAVQAEADRLRLSNQQLTAQFTELTQRSNAQLDAITGAEKKVSEATRVADQAKSAAAEARAEAQATREALTAADPARTQALADEVARTQAALAAAEASQTAAEDNANRARTELAQAQDAQIVAQHALESVQAELAQVREQLAQAEATATTLNAERDKLDAEQDARFARLQEFAEKQVAKLQQENRDLKASLESAKANLPAASPASADAPTAGGEISSLYLRSVISAAVEGIALLDTRGHISAWNPASEKLFGFTEAEAKNKPLAGLVVADDRATLARAQTEAANAVGTTVRAEVLAVKRDGATFPVEVTLSAFAGEGGAQYAVGIVDVTEKRRTEDLRRAKEAADEANRAKSQFLANMSHELRTPLNAIIGFSEILHDRTFGELTSKQDRYVGNILSSGRHLLQLINDILDLSKVEAGHVELEYVAFPVGVAIRNMDALVKALLTKKGVTLEVVVPSELPVLIADQGKFKQVLYNLVSNAIKFTPEGGKVTITATTEDAGDTLRVSVKDTGIGINKEDQERIFKEFEQIDSSYARTQQGTGLGLALARRFVLMHGGRIAVESEGEGKGTTFSFTLPFVPREDDAPALNTTVATQLVEIGANTPVASSNNEIVLSSGTGGAQAAVTHKPIILVVDDDQGASELLTHHLGLAGYTVSRAFTGADAVLLARELNPAVITLDVQLPDSDGYEVLAELKKDAATRNIPVLMVSILADRERALALGAADVFVKPVLKDQLLAAIAREIAAPSIAADTAVSTPTEENAVVSAPALNGTNGRNGKKSNGRGSRG